MTAVSDKRAARMVLPSLAEKRSFFGFAAHPNKMWISREISVPEYSSAKSNSRNLVGSPQFSAWPPISGVAHWATDDAWES